MKDWIVANWFKLLAAVALIGALGNHPYDYYQILRWIVSAAATYIAYASYREKKTGWMWIFGTIAILFNPINPFGFQKNTWQIVDFATAIIFLFEVFVASKRKILVFLKAHKIQFWVVFITLVAVAGLIQLNKTLAHREFHRQEVAYQNCLDKVAANQIEVQNEEDDYRRRYKSPNDRFDGYLFRGYFSGDDTREVDPNFEQNHQAIIIKNFFYQWVEAGRPYYEKNKGYWEIGFMKWMIENQSDFCEEFDLNAIDSFVREKLSVIDQVPHS